jgi:hypothetical protein
MIRLQRCFAASASASIVAVVLAAGSAGATTEPPDGSAPAGGPGCAEVAALLDGATGLTAAIAGGDVDGAEAALAELPGLTDGAVEAAAPEIADEVATFAAGVVDVVSALEGADLSDPDEVFALLGSDEAADAAFNDLLAWATANCGYVVVDPFEEALADAPEPPECDTLDPAVAAEAAGLDVDVTDSDGSGDFNLPGFWTKSCSYGNGSLTISTLSFNSLDDAQDFYTSSLDSLTGAVLDVELGSLPDSTMVIATGLAGDDGTSVPGSEPAVTVPQTVQVAVFEAPVPFSVTLYGADADPDAAVAAAEALLNGQLEGSDAPATTVA